LLERPALPIRVPLSMLYSGTVPDSEVERVGLNMVYPGCVAGLLKEVPNTLLERSGIRYERKIVLAIDSPDPSAPKGVWIQ